MFFLVLQLLLYVLPRWQLFLEMSHKNTCVDHLRQTREELPFLSLRFVHFQKNHNLGTLTLSYLVLYVNKMYFSLSIFVPSPSASIKTSWVPPDSITGKGVAPLSRTGLTQTSTINVDEIVLWCQLCVGRKETRHPTRSSSPHPPRPVTFGPVLHLTTYP